MSSLGLSNSEIKSAIGQLLGISRDSSEWGSTEISDVDRAIRSGRRRFFSANRWKFLVNSQIINTVAPFQAGSITVAAGVVTLTGSTFPALSTDMVLAPSAGGVYTIASRDSDTQITLDDTSLTITVADTTFNMYQFRYALPSNFGGWEGPITLGNDNGRTINERRNLPDFTVRSFASRERPRTGEPHLFSVSNEADLETGVATYTLSLYPLPDKVYVLSTRYRIAPGDTLSLSDSVIVTDPILSECYLESILAAVEIMAFDQPGPHTQRFQQLLPEAIGIDNAMSGTRLGRPRNGRFTKPRNFELIVGTVDLSDQIIS